ncbi:MAG TPA: tRNA dimethylallyltransferase, partial [Limnochordia bacterium]|nr:tRNA dimethylallyltransferase [Limnochordia bacterium]
LEVVRTTGKALAEHWREQPSRSPYRAAWVGLTRPRPELYERIDRRTIEQVEGGLLDEARRLMALTAPDRGVAWQALGYKEMFPYLRGECSLAEATRRLQTANRQYAKRQFTWFAREPRLVWFDLSRYPDLTQAAVAVARHYAAQLDRPLPN